MRPPPRAQNEIVPKRGAVAMITPTPPTRAPIMLLIVAYKFSRQSTPMSEPLHAEPTKISPLLL